MEQSCDKPVSPSPLPSPKIPQIPSMATSSQHHPNHAHLQGLGAGPSATNSVVHRILHPPKLERSVQNGCIESMHNQDEFLNGMTMYGCASTTPAQLTNCGHPKILLTRPLWLYAKHSSGDLHSRLKTRKILGVGETDNGDIHRSKISQLLGHNEHLYVKFPRGFWLWHLSMAVFVTLQGILAFLVPQHFHMLVLQNSIEDASVDTVFATRLSGGALLGMVIIVWHMQGTTEKAQARMSLAAITTHLLLQIIVNVIFIWHRSTVSNVTWSALCSLAVRTLIVLVCVFYHHAIGRSTAGLRKSSSYKDLSTTTTTTTPDKPSFSDIGDKKDH